MRPDAISAYGSTSSRCGLRAPYFLDKNKTLYSTKTIIGILIGVAEVNQSAETNTILKSQKSRVWGTV